MKSGNNIKGMAIISVLMITVIMVIMTVSIVFISTNVLHITGNVNKKIDAIKASEAGVEYAKTMLNIDSNWGTSMSPPTVINRNLGSANGSFTITFDPNSSDRSYNNLFSKDPVNNTPGYSVKIISTGKDSTGQIAEKLQVIFIRGVVYSSTLNAEGKIQFINAKEISILGREVYGISQPGKLHSNWYVSDDPNDPNSYSIMMANFKDTMVNTSVTPLDDRGIMSAMGIIPVSSDNYKGNKQEKAPRQSITNLNIDDILSGGSKLVSEKVPQGTYKIKKVFGVYNNYNSMNNFVVDYVNTNKPPDLKLPGEYITKDDFIALEKTRKDNYSEGKTVDDIEIIDKDFSFVESPSYKLSGKDETAKKDYTKVVVEDAHGKAKYKIKVTYDDGTSKVFPDPNSKDTHITSEQIETVGTEIAINQDVPPDKTYIGDTLLLQTPYDGDKAEGVEYAGLCLNSSGSVSLTNKNVYIDGKIGSSDIKLRAEDTINNFRIVADKSIYTKPKGSRYPAVDVKFDLGDNNLYCDTNMVFQIQVGGKGNIVSQGKVSFMQRVNTSSVNVLAKDDINVNFIPGASNYYAKGLLYSDDDVKIGMIDSANPAFLLDYVKDMVAIKSVSRGVEIDKNKITFKGIPPDPKAKPPVGGDPPVAIKYVSLPTLPSATTGYMAYSSDYNTENPTPFEIEVPGKPKTIYNFEDNMLAMFPKSSGTGYDMVLYNRDGTVIYDTAGLTGTVKSPVDDPNSTCDIYDFYTNHISLVGDDIKAEYTDAVGSPVIMIDGALVGVNSNVAPSDYDGSAGNNSISLDSSSSKGDITVRYNLDYVEKIMSLPGKSFKVNVSSWQRM